MSRDLRFLPDNIHDIPNEVLEGLNIIPAGEQVEHITYIEEEGKRYIRVETDKRLTLYYLDEYDGCNRTMFQQNPDTFGSIVASNEQSFKPTLWCDAIGRIESYLSLNRKER